MEDKIPEILSPNLDCVSDKLNPVFNFLGNPKGEFASYARSFHRSGKILADELFSKGGFNDLDACPVVFLYRHSFELYLKAIVLTGSNFLKLSGRDDLNDKTFLRNHSLPKLLPVIKSIFEEVEWGWDFGRDGFRNYDDFCSFVDRLEKITASSLAFRYPINKKGESFLPKHYVIDIRNFIESMNFILNMFDGGTAGLEEMWDTVAEEAYITQSSGLP